MQHSKSEIKSCTFELESVTYGQGGSICIENVGNVTILESTFFNCKAFDGGSIAVKTESILLMQCTSVYQSYANNTGGGLFVTHNSLFDGTNVTISRGKSKFGAGISVSDTSRINLRMIQFSLNNVSQSGGGISCEQSQIVLDEGNNDKNYAYDYGGGLTAKQCYLTIDNITFSENNALKHGGALYFKSSVTHIHNTKGKRNTAGDKGGFILITGASNLISNYLTLEENLAHFTGNDIVVANHSIAEMTHTKISMFFKINHCSIVVIEESLIHLTYVYSTNSTWIEDEMKQVCADSSSKTLDTPAGLYCFSIFPVNMFLCLSCFIRILL